MATQCERQDQFVRVYSALRQQLIDAKLAPGDQIVVTDWARQNRISPTPVREALARLAGERLVQDRRRIGYFVPLPGVSDLKALYDLLELLLLACVRDLGREPAAQVRVRDDKLAATSDWRSTLRTLVEGAGNVVLMDSALNCIDRLSAAAHAELAIFGVGSMLAHITGALEQNDREQIARAVRADLRERRGRVDAVAQALALAHRRKNMPTIL